MLINLKVKTLDARTHDFSIDNEITIRQFKEQIAEKTNIAAENQRIIYQGRVLADDKLVREYDVDGKVLHVAERPPFSLRGANATNNDEPMRGFRSMPGRPTPRNMRNAPYFRALDGMLVGTMAIPVNNSPLTNAGSRTPPNRFPNSSSFCINRITVAEHMIDCANNIAAYLENPEIGLNNQPLDILQRGHWTMESTVVEVGVSSTDMPRNNNIMDMVQDAVTAALSRNTPGRNYAVVQLPTVYTNEGGEQQQQTPRGGNEGSSSDGAASGATTSSDTSEETTAAAAVIIEDVLESDDDAADGTETPPGDDERSNSPQVADDTAGASNPATSAGQANASGSAATPAGGPRRRTRPQVLGNVFQRYRTVEQRLAPFLDRYHEILQQDPNFEESNAAGRESAQRIFDRVSEALHYLSHAQHAISDLMLDLSQPGPRVLTCRPILVEQSGYIRSNNIFTPNMVATPLAELIAQVPPANPTPPLVPIPAEAQLEQQQQRREIDSTTPPGTHLDQPQTPVGLNRNMPDLAREREEFRSGAVTPRAAGIPVPPVIDFLAASEEFGGPIQQQWQRQLPTEQVLDADDELMAARVAAVVAGLVPTSDNVEDPVDEPMVASAVTIPANTLVQQQQPRSDTTDEQDQPPAGAEPAPRPRFRLYMPVPIPPPNPQMPQLARLIQAAVNSIRNDADLRLEFNVPNMMSINLPVHVMTAAVHPQGRPATATSTDSTAAETNAATAAAAVIATNPAAVAAAAGTTAAAAASSAGSAGSAGSASTSSGTRSGEHRAYTLPTTATQTRSTSRPQIQIGGNNNWAGRIAPTHTAFDRFLPCNSHHIRETETLIQTNNNNNNNNTTSSSSGSSNNRRALINPVGTTAGAAAANVSAAAAAAASAADVTTNTRGVLTCVHGNPISTAASATSTAAAATAAAVAAAVGTPNATSSVVTAQSVPASVRGTNLRIQLRTFLQQFIFDGGPINAETTPTAIGRALDWFSGSLLYLPQYERPEYNSRDSVCNTLRQSLRLIIELCGSPMGSGALFEQQLKQICEQSRKRLYSVLIVCLGTANAELFWRQIMRLLCMPLRTIFRNEALQFLYIYINPTIPEQTDTADAQQFLVLRSARPALPTDVDQTPSAQQPLDGDIEMAEVATSSSATEVEAPLPAVTVGSEPWHTNFPNDWLPVITRDLQTQTEQNRSQPPYSDAYISGMSAKRRKIIQSDKPPANVECLIASGVQRALQNTGLGAPNGPGPNSPAVNPDVVVNAIAHDAVVQTTYTEAVRTNARERLKQDNDYKPSKYPQIAKFTEQK